MKKMLRHGILSALAALLVWAVFGGPSASAQQRENGIASAAKIYGYDLSAGNWTMEVVPCPVMPKVSLLHYRETFPDGSESRLTAVVPVASGGRVRIVPVLHRNATPFVPAPRNPRNYDLFNELVKGSAAKGTWLDLSACYAALTGASSGLHSELGIAGAPRPTVQVEPSGKIHHVIFATREGQSGYKVWNVSFDQFGRVTDASTEDESVYNSNAEPPVVTRAARKHQEFGEAGRQAHEAHRKSEERAATAEAAHETYREPQESAVNQEAPQKAEATPRTPAKPETEVSAENSPQQSSSEEAGWKFIPQLPDPPSKIIPEPPQPSETPLPN